MRPLRIEVEGFSAYRDPVAVDFSGVDFFSLAGPTGSGKSSLIDAMVFALFGRVPRLGGNAVAPAITAGTDRARVRFDFEVDDVVYTAVRMALRTPSGGASVKEARLQQGDTVLADGADNVTTEVEDLLRLRFDDFTRTVVLPQGDFARFLTATKSERQGLLRNLLGLDVYTQVRELARTRAAVASDRAEGARHSLEGLDVPDAESRKEAIGHRDALEALARVLPEREEVLAGLEAATTDARESEQRLVDAIARLDAITAPGQLDDLEALAAEARSRAVDAASAHESAVAELEELQASVAEMPSRERLTVWKRARQRLDELTDRLADEGLDTARAEVRKIEAEVAEALADLETARAATASARNEHSAHLLAVELTPGEPCPVCAREVSEVPEPAEVPVLADLEAAETKAEETADRLREQAGRARAALAGIEASRAGIEEQRDALVTELVEAPDPDQLASLEDQLTALEAQIGEARQAVQQTEVTMKEAQTELEGVADASRQIAKSLTAAQLRVADLEPPVSEADDVTVQWKELIAWRDQTRERLHKETETVSLNAADAESEARKAREALIAALDTHGITAREPYAVAVATELQTARAVVEGHEKAADGAVALTKVVEESAESAAVATALANHLKANGFEQWLMAGALADLVLGANDLLDQLSGGGYSLHSDDSGSFSIVDHRNADEMRSVSTLSGGETFLVSLALALSLAETLAAKGGSGLDAIILDEGFGALDDESLDTVASVLEELTGSGLMVGVITHVKELAARAPVRYEVTREPRGAQVRKVS